MSRLLYSITTFVEPTSPSDPPDKVWPKPLQELNEGDLLLLVRCFKIKPCFNLKNFGEHNIQHFSALKNLQELEIDHLQLSSFMPNIKGYFDHFPKLKTLILGEPKATCWEILYFVGLFQTLQDLRLCNFDCTEEDETEDCLSLIPPLIPPLQHLVLERIKGEKFVDGMIKVYKMLDIRCMGLQWVQLECIQWLLDACAGTLETLRLNPADLKRESFLFCFLFFWGATQRFTTDHLASRSQLNLSKLKSLQTLEFTADASTHADQATLNFLKSTLPTLLMVHHHPLLWIIFFNNRVRPERYEALGKIHKEWNFRLVLCIENPDGQMIERDVRRLNGIVEAQRGFNEDLDSLLSQTLVISRTSTHIVWDCTTSESTAQIFL